MGGDSIGGIRASVRMSSDAGGWEGDASSSAPPAALKFNPTYQLPARKHRLMAVKVLVLSRETESDGRVSRERCKHGSLSGSEKNAICYGFAQKLGTSAQACSGKEDAKGCLTRRAGSTTRVRDGVATGDSGHWAGLSVFCSMPPRNHAGEELQPHTQGPEVSTLLMYPCLCAHAAAAHTHPCPHPSSAIGVWQVCIQPNAAGMLGNTTCNLGACVFFLRLFTPVEVQERAANTKAPAKRRCSAKRGAELGQLLPAEQFSGRHF